jgi:WD40 repeat protein
LAGGSWDKTIKVWNAKTGKCESTLSVDSPVYSVAFSPDGSKIAATYSDKVQLFDAQTQATIGSPLTGHSHFVHSVAWNNDGSKLATGSHDKTIKIWAVGSAGTFECHSTLTGHSDRWDFIFSILS